MKPEELWTAVDYWNDLQKGDLEVETYICFGDELAEYAAQLEDELSDERYATEQFRRANEGLAASKEKLEVALTLERQRTGRVTSELLKSGDLVEIAGEFVPRSQLEDDVLRNTISLLKNENERLTKYVEYSKDDKECMQNEIDVLKSENEALSELLSPLVDVELDRDTLKSALDVAMSENQRLTKIVEDYEEEIETLKRENEALRAQKSALLGSWKDVLGAIRDVGCRAPGEFLGKAVDYWINLKATVESHGLTGVHEKIALLEAKLAAIECGDCGKTMLECERDE